MTKNLLKVEINYRIYLINIYYWKINNMFLLIISKMKKSRVDLLNNNLSNHLQLSTKNIL